MNWISEIPTECGDYLWIFMDMCECCPYDYGVVFIGVNATQGRMPDGNIVKYVKWTKLELPLPTEG
jgi:hypothetical protein